MGGTVDCAGGLPRPGATILPGPWTPEQRARFAATIAARRDAHARGEPYLAPTATIPTVPLGAVPARAPDADPFADPVQLRLDALEEAVASMRSMLVDVHSMVLLMRSAQRATPGEMRKAVDALRIPQRFDDVATSLENIRKGVGRVESKPCRVVEFVRDNRRVKDGGSTARASS